MSAAARAAARIATAAYLEVRNASNANFKDGACTYGEMKAAVNNAAYVMDEVRKFAGLEPWAIANDEPLRSTGAY
jgi:hypothetical protein